MHRTRLLPVLTLSAGLAMPALTVRAEPVIAGRMMLTPQASIGASLGSWDHYRTEADVSGPLNAGTFGPNEADKTFGLEVVYSKASPRPNAAPSEGYQFFGQLDIDHRSQALTRATLWVKTAEGGIKSVNVLAGASDGKFTEIRSRELKAGDSVITSMVAKNHE